jgi:thiosulfate/3-mercaptopyruvate sulfurtransferase
MPFLPLSPLISTDRLAQHIGRPDLVILDGSWYLPNSGRDACEEYRAGHIPGARFFDLDRSSEQATLLPHMLPDAAAFAGHVGGLGIGNDSTVVVYDGSGTNMSAARVWWMFRVFGHPAVTLLDGGLEKWRRENRPLDRGDVRVSRAVYRAQLDRGQIRDLTEVQAALASGAFQVVDVRSKGRFEGSAPEPRPGLRSGHMPGAINLPYTDLVHPDGTALSLEELRLRLAAAHIRLDRPIVASCGSGTSAGTLLHALSRLGRKGDALYDGSWTEWAGRGMPIAEGPGD